MPATTAVYDASCGSVKHVNLMIDTFIANAPATDLRAVVRALLATFPNTSAPFHHVARNRLKQTAAKNKNNLPSSSSLFVRRSGSVYVPTQQFTEVLSRARMLFGAGLGADSLPILTSVIRSTFPLRWTSSDNDPLLPHLAILDSDISQAIQSCKEELASGFIETESEYDALRTSVDELYRSLEDSRRYVAAWSGEFCFDRAYFAVEYWRHTL